jgi:hypothetical protein
MIVLCQNRQVDIEIDNLDIETGKLSIQADRFHARTGGRLRWADEAQAA